MGPPLTKVPQLGLEHYNVAFLKVESDTVSLIGSGTFVQFGSVFGILTADHVRDAVLDHDFVGLMCLPVRPERMQKLEMRKSEIDYVRLGSQRHCINGPDLAFIRLPLHLVGTLQASVSFVNGETQNADFRSGVEFTEQRVDFVTGGIAEWTAAPEVEDGRYFVLFKALANAGHMTKEREVGGLDIMRFKPIPAPDFDLPKSYGGTSGGGLWSLFMEREGDERYRVTHRRLVGVAYWEDPQEDGMHVICHGPQSVYGKLRDMIIARWDV